MLVLVAGSELVKRAIQEMIDANADEVVLEAEVTNTGALTLYRNLGFLRDKRLLRYSHQQLNLPTLEMHQYDDKGICYGRSS